MLKEIRDQCSSDVWQNCVIHTENLITQWYEREKILDVQMEDLVANVDEENKRSSDKTDFSE